jgi:hypothetical protein
VSQLASVCTSSVISLSLPVDAKDFPSGKVALSDAEGEDEVVVVEDILLSVFKNLDRGIKHALRKFIVIVRSLYSFVRARCDDADSLIPLLGLSHHDNPS